MFTYPKYAYWDVKQKWLFSLVFFLSIPLCPSCLWCRVCFSIFSICSSITDYFVFKIVLVDIFNLFTVHVFGRRLDSDIATGPHLAHFCMNIIKNQKNSRKMNQSSSLWRAAQWASWNLVFLGTAPKRDTKLSTS